MSQVLDCCDISTAMPLPTGPSSEFAPVDIESARIKSMHQWLESQSDHSNCNGSLWLTGLAAVTMAFCPDVAEGSNTFPVEHAEIAVRALAPECDDSAAELEADAFSEQFPAYDPESWRIQQSVREYWNDADN